jgi:hypothetical protein
LTDEDRANALGAASGYLRRLEARAETVNCAHGYVAAAIAQAQTFGLREDLLTKGDKLANDLSNHAKAIETGIVALNQLVNNNGRDLVTGLQTASERIDVVNKELGTATDTKTISGRLAALHNSLTPLADPKDGLPARLTALSNVVSGETGLGSRVVAINTAIGDSQQGTGLFGKLSEVQKLLAPLSKTAQDIADVKSDAASLKEALCIPGADNKVLTLDRHFQTLKNELLNSFKSSKLASAPKPDPTLQGQQSPNGSAPSATHD